MPPTVTFTFTQFHIIHFFLRDVKLITMAEQFAIDEFDPNFHGLIVAKPKNMSLTISSGNRTTQNLSGQTSTNRTN